MSAPRPQDDDTLERIGKLVDRAGNVLAASSLPLPAEIHVKGMQGALAEIRQELRDIYTSHGGEDWWSNG